MDKVPPPARRAPSPDAAARFCGLIQSPLRASLLRLLCAHPGEAFDLEAMMQACGRMRLDIENCVRDLLAFGLAHRVAGAGPPRYTFAAPDDRDLRELLDEFLERRPTVTDEDRSPSVQRFREMIGRDEKMMVVFEWIRTAAKSDIPVLVLGPTGCGKEVVARMIHELSRRGANRFQAVNAATVPVTLFEAEIFGDEKGAFTGVYERKPGRLELSNSGTLFLDGIGDMSLVAQARLLRVLEEHRLERLGGSTPIDVDVRLICATHQPLEQLVRDSRFREDLYYRVNACSIRLPSLHERASDIPLLARRFLARYCAANDLPVDGKSFAKGAIEVMMRYHWPGNIRELESTVARAALTSPGRVIRPIDIELLHASPPPAPRPGDRPSTLADAERAHIARVLESVNWNKRQAAAVLDISRGTLYRKILEYALQAGPKTS